MSLFGSKCVRCGSRTRRVYLDKPTCERCQQEIELALVKLYRDNATTRS